MKNRGLVPQKQPEPRKGLWLRLNSVQMMNTSRKDRAMLLS